MASVIYKLIDGKVTSKLIDIKYFEQELKFGGWSTDPSGEDKPTITKEDADTNESGKLSADEVRAAAKEAGIEGYETKRINTLKAELWPNSK